MQGSAALPLSAVKSRGAQRRCIRHYSFSLGLPPFSVVRSAVGKDGDDGAWAPRSAGLAAAPSRIPDDAAGIHLERAARPSALGKLARHGLSRAADHPLLR